MPSLSRYCIAILLTSPLVSANRDPSRPSAEEEEAEAAADGDGDDGSIAAVAALGSEIRQSAERKLEELEKIRLGLLAEKAISAREAEKEEEEEGEEEDGKREFETVRRELSPIVETALRKLRDEEEGLEAKEGEEAEARPGTLPRKEQHQSRRKQKSLELNPKRISACTRLLSRAARTVGWNGTSAVSQLLRGRKRRKRRNKKLGVRSIVGGLQSLELARDRKETIGGRNKLVFYQGMII